MKTELICFDLDDTLLRDTHSVMALCILADRLPELEAIEVQEYAGELDWIEADHQKAALLKGLEAGRLRGELMAVLRPIGSIAETVTALQAQDIRCIIVTAGPVQVAQAVAGAYGFDDAYGSDYEVADGHFTGIITHHVGDRGKVGCLLDYALAYGIEPEGCIAVGDGSTDIPLFEYCGRSIALNASEDARQKADVALDTDDLRDILPHIN